MSEVSKQKELERVVLSQRERQEYQSLVSNAFDNANNFTGSEETYQALMSSLVAMEGFVRNRNEDKHDSNLETDFAIQAGFASSQFNNVTSILEYASDRVYGMLSRLEGLDDLLNALRVGGAHIDYNDSVFVLTDRGFPSEGDGGELDQNLTDFVKQPRLAILVKELSTIGIHTDDLVIRVGKVFTEKVRKLPYIIAEIPRLGKQVAVCDQYGETTFVSQNLLPPEVWASSTKQQLKDMQGVEAVPFSDSWPFRVCNLLAYGTSDITPAIFKAPQKVDIGTYEAERSGKRNSYGHLTNEMILNHMIMHLVDSGEWPKQYENEVSTLPGIKWRSLNSHLSLRGKSLNILVKDFIVAEAERYRDANGVLPDRNSGTLENYPELTWEIIEDSILAKTGYGHRSLNGIYTEYGLLEKEDISLEELALKEMLILYEELEYKEWPKESALREAGAKLRSDPSRTWTALTVELQRKNQNTSGPKSIPDIRDMFTVDQAVKYREIHGALPDRNSGPLPEYQDITFEMLEDSYLALTGTRSRNLARIYTEAELIESEPELSDDNIFSYALDFLISQEKPTWPSATDTNLISDMHLDSWESLDKSMRKGTRGFPGGDSISRLIQRKVSEQAKKYKDIHGEAPNRKSGSLPDYPHVTFDMVADGFYNIPGSGHTTLRSVLIQNGVLEELDFGMELFHQCLMSHLAEYGVWPNSSSGKVDGIEDETWERWIPRLNKGIGDHGKLTLGRVIENLILDQLTIYAEQNSTNVVPLSAPLPDYPCVSFSMIDDALVNKGRMRISIKSMQDAAGIVGMQIQPEGFEFTN